MHSTVSVMNAAKALLSCHTRLSLLCCTAGLSYASIKAFTAYNEVFSKMMCISAFQREVYTPAVVAMIVLLDSVGVIVLLSLLL